MSFIHICIGLPALDAPCVAPATAVEGAGELGAKTKPKISLILRDFQNYNAFWLIFECYRPNLVPVLVPETIGLAAVG